MSGRNKKIVSSRNVIESYKDGNLIISIRTSWSSPVGIGGGDRRARKGVCSTGEREGKRRKRLTYLGMSVG